MEECVIEKKYTNWYVYKNGVKKNIPTLIPMTTEQALSHFKADAVQAIDSDYVDEFGLYVNEAEGKCS